MAFVDNQMTVIGNDISDLSIADEALDERRIDDAGRLSFSTPITPICCGSMFKKELRRSTH